ADVIVAEDGEGEKRRGAARRAVARRAQRDVAEARAQAEVRVPEEVLVVDRINEAVAAELEEHRVLGGGDLLLLLLLRGLRGLCGLRRLRDDDRRRSARRRRRRWWRWRRSLSESQRREGKDGEQQTDAHGSSAK